MLGGTKKQLAKGIYELISQTRNMHKTKTIGP